MTQPTSTVQPWDQVPDNSDAADQLSRLVAGNQNLITQPGLVLALQQNNATPQQAQAIDQFTGGLQAEQKVKLASQSGTKVALSAVEQDALTHMGVQYDSVLYTQQDAINDYATNNNLDVQKDAQGNVVLAADGSLIQAPAAKKSSGWSFGRILHDATHNPVTTGLVAGWNVTEQNVVQQFDDHVTGLGSIPTGTGAQTKGNNPVAYSPGVGGVSAVNAAAANQGVSDENSALMVSLGYDPHNPMSVLAFQARGLQHTDTSDLANQWDDSGARLGMTGPEAVTSAEQFAADPSKFRQSILNDQSLTPEQAAAKLTAITNDKSFQQLVAQTASRSATIGNLVANAAQIDPITHPLAFQAVSGVSDLVASLYLDPLSIGLGVMQTARASQLAIHGAGDVNGITKMFDTTASTGIWQKRVQANLASIVDSGNRLRAATDAGNTVAMAKITAQAESGPARAFSGLLQDIVGTDQITGVEEYVKDGAPNVRLLTGPGEPLDTYEKAADYLAQNSALQRLSGGRAAIQTTTMPGAVSSFGLRRLRGAVAGWQAGSDLQRSAKAEGAFAAAVDPGKVTTKLLSGSDLIKTLPTAEDAVDVTTGASLAGTASSAAELKLQAAQSAMQRATALAENVTAPEDVAEAAATKAAAKQDLINAQTEFHAAKATDNGLASAKRAADNAAANATGVNRAAANAAADGSLTHAQKGDVALNLRMYGKGTVPESAVGKAAGWASPAAIAARSRLAVARFSNFLPRSTTIDLNSAHGSEQIRGIASTYLGKGNNALLRAQYITGDGGARKAIMNGLMDQMGHAAGLPRTEAGQELLDSMRAENQAYSTAGNEITRGGQAQAINVGQIADTFSFPGFSQVQKESAKIGLWEGTIGRAMTSRYADVPSFFWKMANLLKPSTATRNMVETYLISAIQGTLMDTVRARALMKEDGLGDVLGLSQNKLMKAWTSNGAWITAARWYRNNLIKGIDPEVAEAIRNGARPDGPLAQAASTYMNRAVAVNVDPGGQADILENSALGIPSKELRFSTDKDRRWSGVTQKRTGFALQDVDGTAGADRWENAASMRVNPAPDVARAVLDHLDSGSSDLSGVVAAMDDPALASKTSQMSWGHIVWDDGAKDFRNASSPAEIALGKTQFAQKIVDDHKALWTGLNGQISPKLADYIRDTGEAPKADWLLANLKGDTKPVAALAPTYAAVPSGGVPGLIHTIQEQSGKAYKRVVENLITSTTTTPVYLASYGEERVALKSLGASWLEQGISPEAISNRLDDMAMGQGWERAALTVDDIGMKSQLDIVGRNFFAFSRATTTMIRRWGEALWANPQQARRLMLVGEAAVHSGVVYPDSNGNLVYSYPGSGVMIDTVRRIASVVPGFHDIAQFPTSDLTGQVNQVFPGADDPFRYSMSPIITAPMSRVTALFPEYLGKPGATINEDWQKINGYMNGSDASQDSSWSALYEPAIIRNMVSAFGGNGGGALASAMMGSIANLDAAGHSPGTNASPAEVDQYLGRVKDNAKSALVIRSIFAPLYSAPSTVSQNDLPADYAYRSAGSLKDEYKEVLNDVGGDLGRANAIWTAMHPDALAYETGQSETPVSKADLPATTQALTWMTDNEKFLDQYKSVGAYFLPQAAADAKFSMAVYQAQLEAGLRVKKTPAEFYNDVRVSGAENAYYAQKDQYDADTASAVADGNTTLKATQDAQWAAWSKDFIAMNPLFGAKQSDFADARQAAIGKLADLNKMVADNDVPNVPGSPDLAAGLGDMLNEYDAYETFIHAHSGSDTNSTAMRSAAADTFASNMSGFVTATPQLSTIYNGVFRALDSNLLSLSSGGS